MLQNFGTSCFTTPHLFLRLLAGQGNILSHKANCHCSGLQFAPKMQFFFALFQRCSPMTHTKDGMNYISSSHTYFFPFLPHMHVAKLSWPCNKACGIPTSIVQQSTWPLPHEKQSKQKRKLDARHFRMWVWRLEKSSNVMTALKISLALSHYICQDCTDRVRIAVWALTTIFTLVVAVWWASNKRCSKCNGFQ